MRRKNLLPLIERCLSTAAIVQGVVLLSIAGATIVDSWLNQLSGRRDFAMQQHGTLSVHAAVPPAGSIGRTYKPKRGESLGILEVPRLNLSLVILEGSDDGVLKKGPGHIEETAYPGELGNVAIAGHRDTHFRPLRNIRLNDEVILKSKTNTIRYFIENIHIVQPTDMEILDPTPGAALTLVTCYPFEFIGNAPLRYIIRATPRDTHAKP